MSELAYDVNGDAIELPAAAQWWRAERQLDLPNDDNYIAPSGPRARTRSMAG